MEFDWHSASIGPSAGLELSSVGCGAHAKNRINNREWSARDAISHESEMTCAFVVTYVNSLLNEYVFARPNNARL